MASKKKTSTEKLAVFNWKMNPATLKEARALMKKLESVKKPIVVCPPDSFLYALKSESKSRKITFGSQNAAETMTGSLTGEESASMSESVGAKYCLVGHSERRKFFNTTNERVASQLATVCETQMNPIFCFGETLRDDQGRYIQELEQQISSALSKVKKTDLKRVIFAYEPVWAIGSAAKQPITNEELFSTLILIRKILSDLLGKKASQDAVILYGGSVSADNVDSLAEVQGLGGFLVGRASLDDEAVSIIAGSTASLT